MKTSIALSLLLLFVVAGLLLSGYLSYANLFTDGCGQTIIKCGVNTVYIIGLPNCVYGFFMYLIVGVLAAVYWVRGSGLKLANALVVLGWIGTLFALSLSIYELWFGPNEPDGIPACVYGFFLYLGILLMSMVLRRNETLRRGLRQE